MRRIFLGYDFRESEAHAVCAFSLYRRTSIPIEIERISYRGLEECGIYRRPTHKRSDILWDEISNSPMSTEYANARFFVPFLKTDSQWSLYMDCDILCTEDIAHLFDFVDDQYAVMCVKHEFPQSGRTLKRDGQIQIWYPRKYWSSVMLINHEHPAWRRVCVRDINRMDGKELHKFSWIEDVEIGSIPLKWNYLVGITKSQVKGIPSLIHFTNGGPWYPEYREVKFASLWEQEKEIYDAFKSLKCKRPLELRKQ